MLLDETVNANDMTKEMRLLLRDAASFVALYETLEEKISAREFALEEKLMTSENFLNHQLAQVKNTLADFSAVMTETGAARWRLTAEKTLKDGKAHLQTIEKTVATISTIIKGGCEQLEKTTAQTAAGISEHIEKFPIRQFKQIVEESGDRIKNFSTHAIQNITTLIRHFHWKNLMVLSMVTLLVIILTGLFLNDEWPWETHGRVIKERNAGRVLINAWPHLNAAERQDIMRYLNAKPIASPRN